MTSKDICEIQVETLPWGQSNPSQGQIVGRERLPSPEVPWHSGSDPQLQPGVLTPPSGRGSMSAQSSVQKDHRSPEVADWDKRESRRHMDSGQSTSVRQKMGPAVWWTPLPPGQAQPQGRASESVRARWAVVVVALGLAEWVGKLEDKELATAVQLA